MELNLSPIKVDVSIENYVIKSDAFYNVCFITEDDLAPRTIEVKTLNDLLNSGYYRFSLAYDFCRTRSAWPPKLLATKRITSIVTAVRKRW